LALAVAIWSPVQALSAELAKGKKMMEGKMMERCRERMEQKQKMMADMKAQDAELTEQVAEMNSAPEDKSGGCCGEKRGQRWRDFRGRQPGCAPPHSDR
jgi:hypothetical protein